MSEAAAPATGRSCGSCTLCCKVYEVPPVENKKAGQWCRHCKPGQGCGIWDTRPQFCRDFHCMWILDQSVGPEWKPDISRFVMNSKPVGIVVMVDPGHPLAWKREPYYGMFKRMALNLAKQRRVVQIIVNDMLTVITPDEDLKLGRFGDGFIYDWAQTAGPFGPEFRFAGARRQTNAA
jgi:hypothetical protein